MSPFAHDLPAGVYEWIEQIGRGSISRLTRHVARREAWIVDVTRADGSVLEGFLRLQREDGGVDPQRLERETRIIEALGRTDVPVPAVHGWNPDLRATLFARDPGRSDVDKLGDARQQRAVMEDFMRVVARMHRLDLDALSIDDVMTPRPKNARETALNEVDVIVGQWQKFLASYVDPLTTYGLDWLQRFAPEKVARVSLVQGDTGPVNFMFQGDRVSSVIDWELGHWGDPMEDLGNIVVREFWNPSGGLKGLFDLYAAESGIPYTRFAAQYYAVHQNVRGMIPIHAVCAHAHPRESLAWYLCYRYVGDRSTCEMIAQAMEIPISKPPMPEGEGESDVLAEAALYAQTNDVGPAIGDAFARSRAKDVATLVACMDRRRRYGQALERIEQDALFELLGKRPATGEEGVRALDAAIRSRALPDEKVVPYLTQRAYREEWLYAPAVALYPERSWSALD
jgi:aminoglycoside phosphotransferase (APT) family kinase protein